jgi:hypothetical protein
MLFPYFFYLHFRKLDLLLFLFASMQLSLISFVTTEKVNTECEQG